MNYDSIEPLENEIKRLKRSYEQLKHRITELQHKANIEESRSLKRSREEPAPIDDVMSSKKLKSVVVTKESKPTPVEEPTPERKPALVEKPQDKARNRRLFGNLLLGTLNKIKADETREEKDEIIQQRQEVVRTIDEKVQLSKEALYAKEKEKIQAQQKDCQERLTETELLIAEKEKELVEKREELYLFQLGGFVKTIAKPELFFIPAKLDDWTEKVFGIGPTNGSRRVEERLKVDLDSELPK